MNVKSMMAWQLAGAALLLAPSLVGAQAEQSKSRAVAYPAASSVETSNNAGAKVVGEQTMSWLQLQRSGAAASDTPQQATAAERELSYQRLLDSYQHPIPEYFEQEAGGTMSSDDR